ncbi:hypothetical protein GUJ93_ZPchr0013g34147 [Zizania palustris]|uniref:RNase H type-1 domain-containing protein n=1 Tax=Zizania palustris TaxID=103762 RepID=A0A8J6C208_ZIZPA|nr:hypothetical protein GUJ93_ZPchr0013g34147 [Zizania palustris]
MVSRKLRHYFLAHNVIVPTSYPLGDMLRSKDSTGRIGKWAVELAPFGISFVARTAIKSQVLADFVAERTPPAAWAPEKPSEGILTIYSDGAFQASGAGVGAVIILPSGQKALYSARLNFKSTNNTAEYEGILLGL